MLLPCAGPEGFSDLNYSVTGNFLSVNSWKARVKAEDLNAVNNDLIAATISTIASPPTTIKKTSRPLNASPEKRRMAPGPKERAPSGINIAPMIMATTIPSAKKMMSKIITSPRLLRMTPFVLYSSQFEILKHAGSMLGSRRPISQY